MSELSLSPFEIDQIQSSWNRISNKNNFYNELYLNLIEKNPNLGEIFNHDESVITHHAKTFGDCFNFVVSNIENVEIIEEFIYSFVQENQRFSQMSTKYLEPMGNSLILTLKQFLRSYSTSVLELTWVKVYVYFANSILQNEEEIVSETSSLLDDYYVPPLNLSRERSTTSRRQSVDTLPTPPPKENFEIKSSPLPSPPHEQPVEPPVIGYDNSKPNQVLDKFNSIEIDLKSNDKYKGFRRSVDVAASPVKVAIPTTNTFQKTSSHMSATLQLTSPQSNMSSSLRSILDNEEDYFKGSPKPSFDPRRRRNGNTSGYASPITTTPSSPRVQSSASSFTDRAFESPRMVPSAVMSPRIAQQQQQQEETDNEEFVTPSHSRRGSFSESNGYSTSSLLAKLKKFQDPIDTAVEDDEEESNSDNVYEAPSFDPRQLRRRNGDLNKPPQQEQHRIPSPDSYEFDEQEEEDLFINKIKSQSPPIKEQKEESKKQTVPERSLSRGGITGGTFDYQSFGLKGLAPIVEDDDVSSKYESDGEISNDKLSTKSSNQSSSASSTDGDSNSRTSSLSLHNSDYKSSFVSSNGETDSLGLKNSSHPSHLRNEVHSRATSVATDDFQFAMPQQKSTIGHRKNNSIYSLGAKSSMSMNSVSSTGRASLGFMRSSFVLKKEIETQGYNHPENVVMPGLMSVPVSPSLNKKSSNDSLRPSRNSIYLNNKANSVSSFAGLRNKYSGYAIDNNSPEDSSYDLLNSFSQSPPPVPLKDNLRTSHYKYHDEQPKKKSGLLGRISSIFSSSKSSSSSSSTKSSPTQSRKNSVTVGSTQDSFVGVGNMSNSNGREMTAREFYQQQQQQKLPAPLFAGGNSRNCSVSHIPPVIHKVESSGCSISNVSSRKGTTPSISGSRGGNSSQVYGYKYGSNHDLNSVYTSETSTSGFSMLKNTNKSDVKFVPPLTRHTRKGNKYNVKKVPYNIWK